VLRKNHAIGHLKPSDGAIWAGLERQFLINENNGLKDAIRPRIEAGSKSQRKAPESCDVAGLIDLTGVAAVQTAKKPTHMPSISGTGRKFADTSLMRDVRSCKSSYA
jgi:hypothetical protein